MIITTPVTDYIPASLLTTDGDMINRKIGTVQRLGGAIAHSVLVSHSAPGHPAWLPYNAAIGNYLKAAGTATWPTWGKLALRDTGIKIGNETRNSSGDQVITGVGFESSVVIFAAIDIVGVNLNFSIGFDNGTIHHTLVQTLNGTQVITDTTKSIRIQRTINNILTGLISTIGANGFTITWALTGVCSLAFIYLCLP